MDRRSEQPQPTVEWEADFRDRLQSEGIDNRDHQTALIETFADALVRGMIREGLFPRRADDDPAYGSSAKTGVDGYDL
jgi:hypothetical protein